MAINADNMYAPACFVFLKSRGTTPAVETDDTAATGWIDAGLLPGDTTKFNFKPIMTDTVCGEEQIGGDVELNTASLEVSAAQITALEALKGKSVDVILKPTSATETRVAKLLALRVQIGLAGDLGGKKPSQLPITLKRNGVKNIGDFFKFVTVSWSL
jgi:hypothetical protein